MRRLVIVIAHSVIAGWILVATALTPAAAQTPDKQKHMIEGVRNVRYCELVPVVRRGFRLTATVYNTLGLNDCPAKVWDKITEAAMKKRFRRAHGAAQWPAPFRDGRDRGGGRHGVRRGRRRRRAD
jgi:hypothetical protein